jgi:hypothetical protein
MKYCTFFEITMTDSPRLWKNEAAGRLMWCTYSTGDGTCRLARVQYGMR